MHPVRVKRRLLIVTHTSRGSNTVNQRLLVIPHASPRFRFIHFYIFFSHTSRGSNTVSISDSSSWFHMHPQECTREALSTTAVWSPVCVCVCVCVCIHIHPSCLTASTHTHTHKHTQCNITEAAVRRDSTLHPEESTKSAHVNETVSTTAVWPLMVFERCEWVRVCMGVYGVYGCVWVCMGVYGRPTDLKKLKIRRLNTRTCQHW